VEQEQVEKSVAYNSSVCPTMFGDAMTFLEFCLVSPTAMDGVARSALVSWSTFSLLATAITSTQDHLLLPSFFLSFYTYCEQCATTWVKHRGVAWDTPLLEHSLQ
jgi:hypothetical protein